MLPPVFGALAQRPSHSATDVEIAAGRFPVVLYSHGYGSFGGANLLQHEHLASHGFIVASLTHLHEAAYPMRKPFGGPMKSIRPVMKAAQKKFGKDMVQDPAAMAWIMERVDPMYAQADVWEADSRFVADWLFRSPWGPHAVPGRYGAYGHSFGGATAGQLGVRDPRCAGWANLDGGFFCASHREVTSKPGLVLAGSEAIASGLAPGQTGYWEVVVPGAGHYDFMDMRVMLPSFRLAPATGTADPVALSTLMNDWLLAFFKSALLGEPIPATLLTRHGLANVKKH
jgi:predicted dienelactone hydrolase